MFTVRRIQENPVLSPRAEHAWESVATFNPSVIKTDGRYAMYYRAIAHPDALSPSPIGQSSIGRATSIDGIHWEDREQVLLPEETWDAYGCEDPRATIFEGTTYLTYTALGGYPYSKDNIRVGIAIARDGKNFTERHLVTPFNAKAFVIFPERVNGKVAALLTVHTDDPPAEIALVLADTIEEFWSTDFWASWYEHWKDFALNLKRDAQDHVEVGATPVRTADGWLFFYSYIINYFGGGPRVFCTEAAMLDLHDPRILHGRTYPLLVPEENYEHYGLVPDIVFPTSAIIEGRVLRLYYGAADTTCAAADIHFDHLLRALNPSRASRTFARAPESPIISPRGTGFEHNATFNAGAIDQNGSVHILYRAMDEQNTSTFGYARSDDGIHIIERLEKPVYVPRADFESKRGSPTGNSGCEDPRITVIDDRLYVTYTAYDGVHNPRGAISSIALQDFLDRKFDTWTEPLLITPDAVDDKDIGLLSDKVDGEYVLYHRIDRHVCADMLPDLSFKKRVSRCITVLGPRPGMWDEEKVGIAGPPMKMTDGNWLLIYHGVSHKNYYRLGAAMLDPKGLTVIARTVDPIFQSSEQYEVEGIVPNVVFACGSVVRDDTIFLYYGGADRVLGVATASLSTVIDALS